MYMYAYYMHTLYYIHSVDTYMTALFINVYMIMFNESLTTLMFLMDMQELQFSLLTALVLITDRLRIALTLITDSCY